MLETKELSKKYQPKKGVPVQAVDRISLKFPERGMVFLLGKSGSGKSTLLNLLGGLDQYDSGEIIIKGVSSKDFSQQHFDSYRNTYVGFIFQEYNVLEEFTVGANIALALELQGRSATDDELNGILNAVDLAGFGDRKPNELSGGQKQRVAIARALVKNPEIIMADEPTGALDSNTGRQVLDTLKKLSAEKLVIIVSHDREYAEQYADRIIELADGKVIRDVQAVAQTDAEQEKQLIYRASTIEIPPDYHLTEEDRIQINAYLDALKNGASLTLPAKSQRFTETDESTIPQQDGSAFHLIKSKLPMKNAFKIGCSSLKHKRFRLVMTILLSVTAFTLFSLVDTFSSYDHIRALTDSLIDSDVNYISVNREKKRGSGVSTWWTRGGLKFSDENLAELTEKTGIPVTGLFLPQNAYLRFDGQFDPEYQFTESQYDIYLHHFCGFAEITEQSLADMHFSLAAGKLPDGQKDEIAISTALCETFMKAGYHEPVSEDDDNHAPLQYQKISSPLEMVGKKIRLMDVDYTVTGVVDTAFDLSRYESLTQPQEMNDTATDLVNYLLSNEFNLGANYSLAGCAMVGAGKVEQMAAEEPAIYTADMLDITVHCYDETTEHYGHIWSEYYTTLDRIPEAEIVWTDGKKQQLARNEVIISLGNLDFDGGNTNLAALQNGSEELTPESLNALLDYFTADWNMDIYDYSATDNGIFEPISIENVKIVGCIKPDSRYSGALAVADEFADLFVPEDDGIYDSAIGAMPGSRSEIERFVRTCYPSDEAATERYGLNHAVAYELDTVNSALKLLAKVFFWIGLFFAVFAALLMANFISVSINYKRQEIGILRAIGSRSADVFRIFFSESFVIAMIDFVIASALCFAAVCVINGFARSHGILITLLHFGIRQLALLLVISIAVAAAASFLPVHKIASKKPIDAIRGR